MAFKLRGNRIQSLRVDENTSEMTAVSMEEKSNENRRTAHESLRSFLDDTTLHGARFIFVGSVFRRLAWTLALVSCFGYCVYQVYQAVDAFDDRPFTTKITTKSANKSENLSFPAVSFCNFNLFNIRRYMNWVQMKTDWSSEVIEQKLKLYNKMTTGSKDVLTNQSIMKHNEELTWRYRGEDQEQLHYLVLFSHQIEEMLLPIAIFESCFINGKPCGLKNFKSFYNSAYGRCFTFNSGQDNFPVINTTTAGHFNGLKLLLNIERDSYIDNGLIPFVGLTVLVHDQQTFPLMEHFAFAVQPGVHTVCAIKRKKIKNLPKPYSPNCTNRSLELLRNTSYTYSRPACWMQCLTHFIIKKCGCRPIEYKDIRYPLCAPNDTVLCMFPTLEEFGASGENNICRENCPEPCKHTEYETSMSYAGLQRNVFIRKLNSVTLNITKDFPMYEHFLNLSDSKKKEYIDENIISLDIYLQDLSYEEIEQTPKFETWTLISTLGGNFGLFLGMSILTILEFVDFIFRKICFFIFKK